jgi:hypothetical protein
LLHALCNVTINVSSRSQQKLTKVQLAYDRTLIETADELFLLLL